MSSWAPATRPWRIGHSAPSPISGCCSPATWSCMPLPRRGKAPSLPWTRRPRWRSRTTTPYRHSRARSRSDYGAHSPGSRKRTGEAMDTLGAAAELFGALAEPARLHLLTELRNDELSVAELIELTGLKQVNIWKHLHLLERQELVQRRKVGRSFRYSIRDDQVFRLIDLIRTTLEDDNARIRKLLDAEI